MDESVKPLNNETDNIKIIKNKLNYEYEDKKKDLRLFLFNGIKEKYDLIEIKRRVEQNWNKSLNLIENAYIDRKYIKYCSNFWLNDIIQLVTEAIQNKKEEDFLMSLDSIKFIRDVPKILLNSDYYKLLEANNKLMNEINEKMLIYKIRTLCLEQIYKYNTIAKKELEFIDNLSAYLDSCENIQHIIRELDLANFISGKISFDNLLISIANLENNSDFDISLVKESAESLQKEKDYTLLKKIKEIISDRIKPPEIQEKILNDHCIIEIKSRNLKLSEILNNLESRLKRNSNIVEVQFIIAKKFYIDSDLKNDIWHGKNISILVRNINITETVTWNVSGKNSEYKYEADAGTEDNGCGKDGSDGYPGESGGNIYILAKIITNADSFLIFSNGGNGSIGQNGGNGKPGTKGEGISKREFKEKFPSIVKFACDTYDRRKKVKEMIKYIKDLSDTIQCEWYTDTKDPGEDDVYLEVTTRQGNQITFSYCRGGFTRRFQGFLLYKGSLGKPGKPGGKNGLGGEGGYSGSIEVKHLINQQEFKVKKSMNKGYDGKAGKVGEHGEHGKNSWDMGYMDYQFWGETVVYDSSDNNINIVYYENNNSNRVWCPYKEACNRYSFAEMEVHKIKHIQQTTSNNRKSSKENKDRQHFSRATKKKNVLKTNLYSYSHIIELEEDNKLQDLKCQLKDVELCTVQAFSSNVMQQQTLGTGLKINRISSYESSGNMKRTCKRYQNLQVKKEILRANNIETVLNVFINMPKTEMSINQWLRLQNLTLNLNQLNLIYENWVKLVTKLINKNNDVANLELIFVEKYRIAVLQEIALKVKCFEENFKTKDKELTANGAVKYLNDQKKKYSNIHHNVLGSFRQYIFDNEEIHREHVIHFCKKDFLETRKDALGYVFSKFFLELSKTEVDTNTKKYFDDFAIFLKDKKEKIITHYSILTSEISKFRHENILQLMLTNTIGECISSELKNEIEQDCFLKIIYERLNNHFHSTYDWSKCLQEQNVLNFFFDFLKLKGPKSKCYRELLAYVFDVNIRVYCVNYSKGFSLQDNHNSSSSNVLYLLYKDMIFTEIDVNTESFQFDKKEIILNNIYFNILSDIYTLNTRKDLLEYLAKHTNTPRKRNIPINRIFKEKFDEEKDIEKIVKFFPEEENQQIKKMLQKITSYYIGHSGIIRIILRRFENEGRNVSINEMCYLINQMLDSCIKDAKQENTICWIVATVLQENWMAELILIQLETFFMKCLDKKAQFRKYLSELNTDILATFGVKLYQYKLNNIVVSISYVEDTLYLLNSISDIYINLENIELSDWLYVLKEYYWINKIEKLFNWKQSQLGAIPYYILSLENMFGMIVVNEFLDMLAQKNMCKNEINIFNCILESFYDERWNLGREELDYLGNVNNILEWIEKLDAKFSATDTERTSFQLVKLIQGNSNTSTNVLENIPQILNTLRHISNENYLIDGKSVKIFTENDIKIWANVFKNDNIWTQVFPEQIIIWGNVFRNDDKQNQSKTAKEQIFAVINRAIELRRGFQLRDTQKLTIMSLLFNNNSTLAQVSTGEGKSLIVVAVSIIKALCGEKVDVVTSSSVLAIRDAVCNKDIYDLFNINVSHNCSENIEKRKESYSNSTVIYGDLSNFQRDYLLDRFYGKNILGDHDFSNIIIDEVDSMLLDKGNNMLYLSHDIAGLDKLESVYVYIWCIINRPVQDITDLTEAMNATKIKEAVLSDMYGIIKKNDIEKLDVNLDEIEKASIWNFLMSAKILNAKGQLLIHDVSDVNLDGLSSEFLYLKEHIEYLIRESIERQRFIYVPEYLKSFIERHLESWINSAIAAFFMKAGEDYVVDVDRTRTISDGNPIITIIDRDTGTDQTSSQWDEALHQFLQLKHGCKLTMQSLKAVFISNVSFFKLYRKLYGLTGTLGSQRERDLLKEVHNVDFVTIPTAKSKKFHEITPIVCRNKEIWIDSLYDDVKTVVNKERRSVLIICQLVDDVEFIQRKFINRGIKNIHTYTRDYEEFEIARGSKKFEEGQIIIATNLAGRGTDIVLTETLKERGGLHVCLTYLPSNIRIERQAFGRAARCGDRGTGRLIIVDGSYQGGVTSKVLNLKKERDTEELNRISSITNHYKNKIKMEENCFEEFKILYDKMKNHFMVKNTPQEVQSILLQCCLDEWAFWLDEKSQFNESNKNIIYESFQIFITQLKRLLSDLPSADGKLNVQNCFNWVKDNPVKMVNLGKYFLKENEFNEAISLFNTVINKEVIFSAAAHYYKAFALSKQINWEKPLEDKEKRKSFKRELCEASILFQSYSERGLHNATLIDKIKENNSDSIIQIKAYMQQQHTFSSFYNIYVKSIDDILGTPVTALAFRSTDIDEALADVVFEDLLKEGILKKPKIKNDIHEFELKSISRDFGISPKMLYNFLSKYKGQALNEKKFIKAIKNEINLASCEQFWKILIEQGILFDEVKFVIIDKEKLGKVDPSFLELLSIKISSRDIRTPDVEDKTDDEYGDTDIKVFVNGQCIRQQKNENNIILYKDELVSLDAAKFVILKRKGVLLFNKMASIEKNKITTVKFIHHDSIVVDDFHKINISLKQGEEILTELVAEGVLEREEINKNKSIYKLKVKYEKITDIKLNSRQVYRNSVIGLLFTCFAYRIAIQKLEKQLKENTLPIHLQLMTKPHHNLVFELLEHKILKHVKVSITNESKSTEECVKDLFSNPMSEEKMLRLFIYSELIPRESASELFNNLISAEWIAHDNPVSQVIHGKLYKIRNSDEIRQHLISFKVIERSVRCLLNNRSRFSNLGVVSPENILQLSNSVAIDLPSNSSFRAIQKSLRNLLDSRSRLGTENAIRILVKTLNQLKSSIKSLTVPDNNLKPLTDYFGSNKFLNVDELHIMCLNGLDHVQFFEEKKNTKRTKIYTALVFGLGVVQIAVGVIIQYYSMGLMTHIGAVLISEGISDMLYATSALKSGHFNWNDYLHHKVQSIIFSAVTVGVGAILSRGALFSRFGHKLFGPTLQNTCGNQLVENVGKKVVFQSICKEAVKGIAICMANYGADAIVHRYLRSFCENVGSVILSNIENEVDNHNLSNSLEKVYKRYGDSKAKNAISELTDIFFYNHNMGKQLLPIAIKISNSIAKGITEAANKTNSANSTIQFAFNNINKILVWSNRVMDLYSIQEVTKKLLDDLDKEINKKLKLNAQNQEQLSSKENFSQEKYDNFKTEITDKWKCILRHQAGQVIEQHVVSPILEDCMHKIITLCGKKVKDVCRSMKESGLESKQEELRKQYKKDIEEAKKNLAQNTNKTKEDITGKYHENLLKLLDKTNNPTLFADIILENVPMDLTCFMASGPVIQTLLRERGINIPEGLTIVVHAGNGLSHEISLGSKSNKRKVIELELKHNHYQLAGTNIFSNDCSGEVTNDCLYQALVSVIPDLRELGQKEFRTEMAKCIKLNPEIQRHIKNGWHKFPIRLKLFGGRREKVPEKIDPESTEQDVKDVDQHLVDRVMRLFRLIGTTQRISEETKLPRRTIIKGGRSQFQDKSSKRGPKFQAAHLNRARIGDGINQDEHADSYNEVKNILGHTQIVPRFANEWHGIGGVIDRFQEDALKNLLSHDIHDIDFKSDSPNGQLIIISSIQSDLMKRITKFCDDYEFKFESDRISVKNGVDRISNIKPEELYKAGAYGYSGKYKNAYM